VSRQHPDAQWLAALFPPGVSVTEERMREVMMQQGDDPRVLYFASQLVELNEGLLRRAAERGYARAQADLAVRTNDGAEKLPLLEKACEQNDRDALFLLGRSVCETFKHVARGIELLRRAAELNHREAQFEYGELAFDGSDWERYFWWGKAAEGGADHKSLCLDISGLLPKFERGECSRILFTAAP
jgi:hypothetical protein